jgi:hypothetical protein
MYTYVDVKVSSATWQETEVEISDDLFRNFSVLHQISFADRAVLELICFACKLHT